MSSSMGLTPMPPPPRLTHPQTPQPKVTFQGAQTWRESVAMFMLAGLAIVVFISAMCTVYYVYRNRQTYEELVDYLDKTISISKINYNIRLGEYRVNEKEHDVLRSQQTYKTATLIMLLSECGCYVFISIGILLYFCSDVAQGTVHLLYWFFVAVTVIYAVIQIHLFVFFLFPYSNSLPNQTELLLNHAIPYNPAGLLSMEQRFGCTFDLDIYKVNKRRLNPMNTCDPEIEASFYPTWLLITLGVLRLIPVVLFVLLAAKRTPLSEFIAQFVERFRPSSNIEKKRLYVKKQHYRQSTYQSQGDFAKTNKTTTFGTNKWPSFSSPLTECIRPPAPSPGVVDHGISYNNAAYFAREGAYGPNSTRSSEISRIDALDLNRASHHNSGTIMSDV